MRSRQSFTLSLPEATIHVLYHIALLPGREKSNPHDPPRRYSRRPSGSTYARLFPLLKPFMLQGSHFNVLKIVKMWRCRRSADFVGVVPDSNYWSDRSDHSLNGLKS